MLLLIIGLVIFFASHVLPMQVALRRDLRERLGAKPYELGIIVASLIGLALIVYGYGKVQGLPGKNPILWVPPVWTKHLLWMIMWLAMILLAASLIPSRIRDWVGHPMLLSTQLWATGHLLANGSAAAILLFGSFLAWSVLDLISVRRRGAKGPLGARTATAGGDAAAVALGTTAYLFMLLWGHAWLIGVAAASFSFAP